jgi:hypothetical protein
LFAINEESDVFRSSGFTVWGTFELVNDPADKTKSLLYPRNINREIITIL